MLKCLTQDKTNKDVINHIRAPLSNSLMTGIYEWSFMIVFVAFCDIYFL